MPHAVTMATGVESLTRAINLVFVDAKVAITC